MTVRLFITSLILSLSICNIFVCNLQAKKKRPNILFAISDDQSFAHTSAMGYKAIKTPSFDSIAKQGVLMTNAFCASPGCSPSRAAILTGRYTWQIEHAGTHASSFPKKFAVYPELLEKAGYAVGYTGKGWGPGNWKVSGRKRNPVGPAFQKRKLTKKMPKGISNKNYAANFEDFLNQKKDDQPFSFWFGGHEPHRVYMKGIGVKMGGKLEDVVVPPFLPDTKEVRSDILDYCYEIEHFDNHLGRMIKLLKERGELENTLIVVTGDNGMPFPRAKSNCYEYGIHMPMAISWPAKIPSGRKVDDLVSFIDLAPTFLELAGVKKHPQMIGKSLLNVLISKKSGIVDPTRTEVYSARERHSSSRWNNLAYPMRAMRTADHLIIRNFRPERWPAGAPQESNGKRMLPRGSTYTDIDNSPTLQFLLKHQTDKKIAPFFHLAVDHRPEWECYDIRKDPGCLTNMALMKSVEIQQIVEKLKSRLNQHLTKTGDPRIIDGGEIFETYKRYSRLRKFVKPDWAKKSDATKSN